MAAQQQYDDVQSGSDLKEKLVTVPVGTSLELLLFGGFA